MEDGRGVKRNGKGVVNFIGQQISNEIQVTGRNEDPFNV